MEYRQLHPWNLPPTEATALQRELASLVNDTYTLPATPRFIAGLDVSSSRFSPKLYAGIVVCDTTTWEIVETAEVVTTATFPYIPGYLSFREAPPLLEACGKLHTRPDLLLVDGNGRAHPRQFGIACHLGVLLDLPTIGCGKTYLVGDHGEPGRRRGCYRALTLKGTTIGRVLRTRDGVKPVYISVGHKITLSDACRIVLSCCRDVRLPEPIRQAHDHVNALRRQATV